MFKFAVVMAALLAAASAAMADPTLNAVFDGSGNPLITDLHTGVTAGANTSFFKNYDYSEFSFLGEDGTPVYIHMTYDYVMRLDVAVASMDTWANTRIAAFGLGLQITGPGANHLAPLPRIMCRSTSDWTSDGLIFPFSTGPEGGTNSDSGPTVAESETFGYVVDNPSSTTQCKKLPAGTRIARFYYLWNGVVETYSTAEAAQAASAMTLTWTGDDMGNPWLASQQVAGVITFIDASFNPTGPLYVPYTVVPEPATLSLLGLGLAGLFSRRRK